MAKKRYKKFCRRLKRKMEKLQGRKNRPRNKKKVYDPAESLRILRSMRRGDY